MYCTRSMIDAIRRMESAGLEVPRIFGMPGDTVIGFYVHPYTVTVPFIPEISVYGHTPAVEWDADSGRFTVYSAVKYVFTTNMKAHYSTDRSKGWLAESYNDIQDGIAALAENLRYQIEKRHDAEIEKSLEVLD